MNNNSDNQAAGLQSPVSFPTFTINGKDYQVRFTLGVLTRLRKQGISIPNLQKDLEAIADPFEKMSRMTYVASFAMGQEVNGLFVPAMLSPDQVEDAIGPERVGELMTCVNEALKKASQVIMAQTPAIPEAPPQIQ